MDHDLLIAFLAGLGGMVGWGFSEFATKKSVDIVGTITSLVWAHVFGTVILFAVLFSRHFLAHNAAILPSDATQWLQLIGFGSLQTAVYYFAYKAFEEGEVSVLSPIFASYAGIVALLSVLVLGETLHVTLLPVLVLIFTGTILINIDIKGLRAGHVRIKAVAGLREVLIATILAAIWTLGWDKTTQNKDWLVYTSFMFLFMTVSAYVLARQTKTPVTKVQPQAWRFLWFIAVGEVVAYLAVTLGYSRTAHASIVAILSGASSLVTIILARMFLKEKMSTLQITSSIIIITGIVFLAATA